MNPLVAFTVYGRAAPAGSKTTGTRKDGRRFVRPSSKYQKPWQAEVKQVAGQVMEGRPLLEGPLRIDALFFRPRPQNHYKASGGLSAEGERTPFPITHPDTTKLLRAVEDAIQGTVVRNDAQFCKTRANQVWGEPARAMIEVHPA